MLKYDWLLHYKILLKKGFMARFNYYINPDAAVQKQNELRESIRIEPLKKEVQTIAGADISFNRGSDILYAGFVILRLPDLKVTARSLARVEVNFPYIPGLLAFREIPALMAAWKQIPEKPDVVIVDGHGIAHPRRMGIATHFGVLADQPTIGCAKNLLTGTYVEPDEPRGSYTFVHDGNENIGMAYRSRDKVNPVFISPGHRTSFDDARKIIEKCLTGFKLPETTRKVHEAVNEFRKRNLKDGYWENPTRELFS